MNVKTLATTVTLGGLFGLSVLAGSVLVNSASAAAPVRVASRQAQAAQTTPTAGTTQTPNQAPQPGERSHGGVGRGPGGGFGPGKGGGGHGPGGFDGGRGPHGGQYTTEGASRTISATAGLIDLVKGDLTYANGKTDTGTAQDWVNQADGLLNTARTASTGGQFGRAVETANAARGLAGAAELLLQQALGAETLPSYTQRQFPGRGHGGPAPAPGTAMAPTQAQASRELANLYNQIQAQAALGNAGNAGTYLNGAKDYYRTAYTAYQAGNYADAHEAAIVSRQLLGVAGSLQRAETAPNSPDAPVTVPAPNF